MITDHTEQFTKSLNVMDPASLGHGLWGRSPSLLNVQNLIGKVKAYHASCLVVITVRNGSWGKVMFLHLSVILLTGLGVASVRGMSAPGS